jgi:hypothetical protein
MNTYVMISISNMMVMMMMVSSVGQWVTKSTPFYAYVRHIDPAKKGYD